MFNYIKTKIFRKKIENIEIIKEHFINTSDEEISKNLEKCGILDLIEAFDLETNREKQIYEKNDIYIYSKKFTDFKEQEEGTRCLILKAV